MKKTPPGILPVIAIDRECGKPLNRQIYEGYRDAIVERRLRSGQRIPPTRGLAAELRVSRLPVLNAFEQLLAEGYFESRPGAGTFVASSVPDDLAAPKPGTPARPRPPRCGPRLIGRHAATLRQDIGPWFKGVGAFSVGQPPVDQFPWDLWSRLVARRSRSRDPELVHYSPVMGFGPLREAVAEYLRTARGVRCEASQVMIVGGAQQALELSARVLLDAGSSVWVEDPGCYGVQNLLRLAGARTVPVPVDAEGLVVAEGIARSPKARAVFVTPSHQFPLGVTMSASRRLQLLDWAQSSGAWIIEDDYDSEYRYGSRPLASLQGLDTAGQVIYVGSFGKTLFPGLRIGYLVVPEALAESFATASAELYREGQLLQQAMLAEFIAEGHFTSHIRKMRTLYGQRRSTLLDAAARRYGDALPAVGGDAGLHLVMQLPEGTDDRAVAAAALERNIVVRPLSGYYAQPSSSQSGLLIGYACVPDEEIAPAFDTLADAIDATLPLFA
jgi:GntR family transcriptional regulator/MocR family aminotransferase